MIDFHKSKSSTHDKHADKLMGKNELAIDIFQDFFMKEYELKISINCGLLRKQKHNESFILPGMFY